MNTFQKFDIQSLAYYNSHNRQRDFLPIWYISYQDDEFGSSIGNDVVDYLIDNIVVEKIK